MVLGTATDPFRAIYVDKAVQDIIESLGVRHGKETEFIQIVLTFVEQCYSNVKLAREAVADEELSRVFIHKCGERIWSDKNLIKLYYRVEWSRFADIAAILFAPPLNRLWPSLESASDIQFPHKSVLGSLSTTPFQEDAGQQQESPERRSSECGGVTTQGSRASSPDLSKFSTSTSQESRTSTTADSAAVPRLSLGVKAPPNANEDVLFSTTTTIAGQRAANNSPLSPQVLPAVPTPTNASEQMLRRKMRESAVKLRLAENASPVAKLKEKIRLTVKTMEQPPEKEPEALSEQRISQKPHHQTSLDWLLFDGSGKPTVRLPVVGPRWSAFPTVPGPEDLANVPERPETVPLNQVEQLLLSNGSMQATVHLPAVDLTQSLFHNVAGREKRSKRTEEPETVPSNQAERLLPSDGSGQAAAVYISRLHPIQHSLSWTTRFEQLRNEPIPDTVPSNQAERLHLPTGSGQAAAVRLPTIDPTQTWATRVEQLLRERPQTVPSNQAEGLLLSEDSGQAAAVRLPAVNPLQNHFPNVPGRRERHTTPAPPEVFTMHPGIKRAGPLAPRNKLARVENDRIEVFLEVGQVVAGVRSITGDENFGDQLLSHLRKVTGDKTLGESWGTKSPPSFSPAS